MNSKNVLNKILSLLSKEEVVLTYAKLADGTIVESATFDVGEDLFVVSEDGTKSPAPNGTHDLMLKDTEGNETYIKVISEDGKIVERENVELADVKTEPIPQGTGEELPENVRPTQPNSVESGTLKMAEETEEAMPIPADEDKSMEEEGEKSVDMGKMMEDMAYRIEEMEKKMAKMEAMYPPVASQVIQEEEGIKMSAEPDEEEELPKLDGAPVEENPAYKFAAENKKTYGKKVKNSQSNFLSKLYN
jgi:hypothetical protein